jgi:hypothetical protein
MMHCAFRDFISFINVGMGKSHLGKTLTQIIPFGENPIWGKTEIHLILGNTLIQTILFG